jgi:lysophospholipase L1-like esterase
LRKKTGGWRLAAHTKSGDGQLRLFFSPPKAHSMQQSLIQLMLATALLFNAGLNGECVAASADSDVALPETNDGLPGEGPIRRYDWFRKLWQQKRSQFASEVESKQDAVVFLGDSITQGWGDDFRGHFEGMHIANRGISGDTTRGMLIRLKEDVLDLNPSAVVLLMGTNDLEEMATPEMIAGNLKLIVEALKKHNPKMPILLCDVFPSSESKKRSAEDIRKINTLYAAVVKGDSQITRIDTWTLFANGQGDAKPEEFPDLLHPNDAGYNKWAAALVPVFATFGLADTVPDTFRPEAGFVSLFNGRDLTGWGYRPTSEEMLKSRQRWQSRNPNAPPWPVVTNKITFDGQTSSPDGRYVAINGRLVVTTPPEGRKIQQLWTTGEFNDDFVLKLEFRATPNADSGVFIRKPQLQCRDFVLAGPYKDLKNYKPQQWNALTVVVKGDTARCTCNGEVIEAAFQLPATGPIGLEGDRGQMEYRRIRINLSESSQ